MLHYANPMLHHPALVLHHPIMIVPSIKPGSSSPNDDASSSILEYSSLMHQSAKESLKIYYTQPNIPRPDGRDCPGSGLGCIHSKYLF
ncbi:MAG TPA: hypothetical protein DDW50_21605 [Firmicutes bacterium]|nr:hypothetical protein [Bacillota bacterium]